MRFIALGPLFFFFRRATARSDLESFGTDAISNEYTPRLARDPFGIASRAFAPGS